MVFAYGNIKVKKVSRVCVHLFCRESSKINNKKMMHSGVNNGIAGSQYFGSGFVKLSTFLHNL